MKALWYFFLFQLLLLPGVNWANDCEPPTVVIIDEVLTGTFGFLSLTENQTIPNLATINFTGPSNLSGGVTGGGTSLTVPATGNYLITYSVVSSGDATTANFSNFGVHINGTVLAGGIMDNTFEFLIPLIFGTPYSLSMITTLAAGDVIDVRNISISGTSQTLTATNPPAGLDAPSTRACLTVIRLS